LSTPTALDHSDALPNRFLDQACSSDHTSHDGHPTTHSHPNPARSLAPQLGPALGSQRSSCDCSPTHPHHSWSSSYICHCLRIWSLRRGVSADHLCWLFPPADDALSGNSTILIHVYVSRFSPFSSFPKKFLLLVYYYLVAHLVGGGNPRALTLRWLSFTMRR